MKHLACLLMGAALLPAGAIAQERTDAERDAEIARLRETVELLTRRLEAVEAERDEARHDEARHDTTHALRPPPVAGDHEGAPHAVLPSDPLPVVPDDGVAAARRPAHGRDTIDDDAAAVGRPDFELLAGEEELEGFFPIRGTESWLRLGGYAKLDAMYDTDDAGNTDLFLPSDIPAGRQAGHSGFNAHARQTRLTIDARRPTRAGWLRFVLENDFFGSDGGHGYRLRHAYGQIGNTMAGFGFSAFMDLDSSPDTLDFGGPGPIPSNRLPTLRRFVPLKNGNLLVFSAEHSVPELWQGNGEARERSTAPNLVFSARHSEDTWHMQLSTVLRYMAYMNGETRGSAIGGGAALTGSWGSDAGNYLVYGLQAGRGIAAHISDISGLGLDAVVAEDGSLDALDEWGAWIGYTQPWSQEWRSTVTYGRLYLERNPWLAPDVFRRSDYAAANLVWSPVPSWTWGVELLYGKLQRQDGVDGDAIRLQTSLKYDFIK